MKTIAVLLIKKDNLEPMIIKRNVKIHIKIRFNLSCETCSKYVVKRFPRYPSLCLEPNLILFENRLPTYT